MKKKYGFFACFLLLATTMIMGCTQAKQKQLDAVDVIINNEDQLTQIIIYDVFTPPVASGYMCIHPLQLMKL